uniref:Uncharacterized protein n=1 Tax=Steinernema glaseri TaxID=37863 RepID=A0A1I7Z223_9BILA
MNTRDEQRLVTKRREEVEREACETMDLLGKCSDADLERVLDLLRRHTVDLVAGVDMNALQYHSKAVQKTAEVFDFLRSVRLVDEPQPEKRPEEHKETPMGKSPKIGTPSATTPTKKYLPPGNPNRTTPCRSPRLKLC